MPLYLCALQEITPAATVTLTNGTFKLPECNRPYTLVKKDKCLNYQIIKSLDVPYFFQERRIYRLADDVSDLFYWRNKIDWLFDFDEPNIPFSKLGASSFMNTLFAADCLELAREFLGWDAYIEHESQGDPDVYRIFQILNTAINFSKNNGALWYFEWEEDHLDEYFERKKWYGLHNR